MGRTCGHQGKTRDAWRRVVEVVRLPGDWLREEEETDSLCLEVSHCSQKIHMYSLFFNNFIEVYLIYKNYICLRGTTSCFNICTHCKKLTTVQLKNLPIISVQLPFCICVCGERFKLRSILLANFKYTSSIVAISFFSKDE